MISKIHSMTAFAMLSAQNDFGAITWEIRALNHRYLDCNVKLPDLFSSLEMAVRDVLREKLGRGRIDCYLKYQPKIQDKSQLKLDNNLTEQIIRCAQEVSSKIKNSTGINPMDILAWPNILEKSETDVEPIGVFILDLFKHTLVELLKVREREGAALTKVILNILKKVTVEIEKAKKRLPQVLNIEREKIITKFAELKAELDINRLEQEMILFTQRIDVAEELDRLDIHAKDFQRILDNGGNVGKRLDFLLQELNREANTLAAKSPDIELSASAIELKVLLEQIREQVQNLE